MNKKLKIKQTQAPPEDKKFRRHVRKQLRPEMRNKNLGAPQFSSFLGKKKEISQLYRNIDFDKFEIEDADQGTVKVGDILQGSSRELKQATSAGCRAYVDHCVPVDMHLFIDGPSYKKSVATYDLNSDPGVGYYDISNSAYLESHERGYFFKLVTDMYYLIFVYVYEIPAPTCDAQITWAGKFKLSGDRLVEDAKYFVVGIEPIAFSSPDGTPPTLRDLCYATLKDHPSCTFIKYHKKKLEELTGSTDYHTICQSYDVSAGVSSKVYFGFGIDLRCKKGQVGAEAFMDFAAQDPATTPDKAINFASVAKEFSVNCYITTAICEVLGKADDCRELNLLRDFRDNYLIMRPDGKALIENYYQRSPGLLRAIKSHPSGKEILENLYNDYLSRCIALIEEGDNEVAVEVYKNMVYHLESVIG